MITAMAWAISLEIIVIAILIWGLLMIHARRSELSSGTRRRFAGALTAFMLTWVILTFTLGAAGLFRAAPDRGVTALLPALILPLLIGGFLLYRKTSLNTVISAIPLHWLVGIQFYRIVGVNFLVLYSLGLLPGEFAIPAGAGDAIVGLAAPVIGYMVFRGYRSSRAAVLGWNIFGILDLLVAVATGFLSSPGRFQAIALGNSNVLVSAFPLVLVPLFAVPTSVLLHLAVFKRLNSMHVESRLKRDQPAVKIRSGQEQESKAKV